MLSGAIDDTFGEHALGMGNTNPNPSNPFDLNQ